MLRAEEVILPYATSPRPHSFIAHFYARVHACANESVDLGLAFWVRFSAAQTVAWSHSE